MDCLTEDYTILDTANWKEGVCHLYLVSAEEAREVFTTKMRRRRRAFYAEWTAKCLSLMPDILNANDYDEDSTFLIATDAEGRFLGYACWLYEGVCRMLLELYVEPGLRRSGVGTVLMKAVEDMKLCIPGVEAPHLEILTSGQDSGSLEFFRSLGYTLPTEVVLVNPDEVKENW